MDSIKLVEKRNVWDEPEKDGLYASCHCSTLVKNEKGDIMTAYFAGAHEGSPDQGIWISRRIDGQWQKPKRVKYMYGFIHWNPLLHYQNGVTWLFYKVGMSVAGWYTMVCESRDFGETWTESREMIEGDHTPRGSSKNKFLLRNDGAWLAPGSVETERDWDCHIEISTDKGQTWSKHPIHIDHYDPDNSGEVIWKDVGNLWISDAKTILRWDGIIQPTLWQSEGNNYHALMRSTRGRVYRSDSTDGAETWSDAYPTELPNNNCGIDLCKLADGTLVLVYNPVSGNWAGRTPLSISLSRDNGYNWTKPWNLESDAGEYSYPAIIPDVQTAHITYTHDRKRITYCRVEI